MLSKYAWIWLRCYRLKNMAWHGGICYLKSSCYTDSFRCLTFRRATHFQSSQPGLDCGLQYSSPHSSILSAHLLLGVGSLFHDCIDGPRTTLVYISLRYVQLLPDLYDISEIWAHKRPPGRRWDRRDGGFWQGGFWQGRHWHITVMTWDQFQLLEIAGIAEWGFFAFHFSAGAAVWDFCGCIIPGALVYLFSHFIQSDRTFCESEVIIEQFGGVSEYRDRSLRCR